MVRVVGIGASAGGIEALHQLLPRLLPRWDLAFAIVLHRQSAEDDARLESLLNGWSPLRISKARDGEQITAGRAVVCPAGVHLEIAEDRYHLSTGPRENHSRPSIDVLFRSIARARGAAGGGIILSGMLDDGAAGVRELRLRNALTIAQQPEEAMQSSMPRSAIAAGAQHVLAIEEMPAVLERFARTPINGSTAPKVERREEHATRLTCPDCGGVLVEQDDGVLTHYACRVGHTFSPETLHAEKSAQIEEALWAAIQVLDEQAQLTERVERRVRMRGDEALAQRMYERAQRFRRRAATVRQALPTVDDAIATTEVRANLD